MFISVSTGIYDRVLNCSVMGYGGIWTHGRLIHPIPYSHSLASDGGRQELFDEVLMSAACHPFSPDASDPQVGRTTISVPGMFHPSKFASAMYMISIQLM